MLMRLFEEQELLFQYMFRNTAIIIKILANWSKTLILLEVLI